MTESSPISQEKFRKILARNVATPLIIGLLNAAFFAALVIYLLSLFGLAQKSEEVISKSHQVTKLALDMQTGIRGFLLTGDEKVLAPREAAKARFATEMANLQMMVREQPEQMARLERVVDTMGEWESYAEAVVERRRQNREFMSLVQQNTRSFDGIRTEMLEFQEDERDQLQRQLDQVRTVTIMAVLGYIAISLVMAGFVSFFSRRELVQLSMAYDDTLTRSRQNTELLEYQAWQRTGQADLAARCAGQTSLPVLGNAILNFLAEYLDVVVAALYVKERDGVVLRRIAAFGFSADSARVEQVFAEGESLVAQTVSANRVIELADIPRDYLKVNSGLGSSTPTHVMLVPVHYEGNPNGVLELGFLHKPDTSIPEFLALVAPNIGNNLEMALNRRRLQTMLEETQQLNEELQVQQEEMRTTNEELEEQARALEESKALLENQKAELEQNNEKLTEQALLLDEKNTDLNKARTDLERHAQDLQRASRYKSEFLANMSHELRTPLNSSMILAKLLAENQRGNLDEEQVRFARSIYSSGNDLLTLINDILDISKVEAGKLELVPESVSVQSLLDGLMMTFEPLAKQKQLQFRQRIDSKVSPSIYTDPQRLEQILKNLLSNAFKFTEQGSVELSVFKVGADGIEFRVMDTGIGIARDQQRIVFEAFQQAEGGISRRFGGSGLGLSISRDLARLLGGAIHLESEPGRGSTFTLSLPVTMPSIAEAEDIGPVPSGEAVDARGFVAKPAIDATPVAEPAPPALPDDRADYAAEARGVLVIEDDLEFARILYQLAHELSYQCLLASTATEGIKLAEDYLPDAILLDIGLPDISGISVLQKLKTESRTRHIPVHIISASDRAESAMQLGAVGYVVKPTSRERLREVFGTIETRLSQKTRRVLLVEDDKTQREAVVHLIGDEDVEITAVETGTEALEHLRSTVFDCMIIDLKLPDMQGHELLQQMSSEDLYSFPPVIVYTGRNLTRSEEHELLKYSRSIIIKGARSPERLLDEVTLFLHKVESELSVERQKMLKTARGRDRALEGRRILVVDDDVRNVFALTGALEMKGAMVEIARNGYEAVSQVTEGLEVDLVLMDIMMPGMDGLEATRRIRADERFRSLPIIAVTAKAMKNDQEECLKAGASDYMAKPIDLDRLYSLLRVWLPSMERLS